MKSTIPPPPAKKKQEKSVNSNTKWNPLKDLKLDKSKRKKKTEVSTRKEKSVRKKGNKAPTSKNLEPISSTTNANQPSSTPNATTGSTEQVAWPNEAAAKKLLQQNTFQNSRITEEFAAIKTTTPKEDACAEFFKNPKKNRNVALPIADATRLKLKNPSGGYINAAKITNPADSNRTLIIGQIPETSELEEFWRMIFDETILHVFFGYVQTDNITLATFLPTTMGAFATFGKMFLNVKKVETIGKEINCIHIELLPDGCSNSTLVTVYNQPNWNLGKVPANVSDCIAICEKMNKASDAILFCSWNGVGRAGTMLMIHSVMAHVIKNVDCKIGDLLQALRNQRFGIVENSEQYLAIYQAIGFWIKSKSGDAETTGKLNEFCASLK